MQAWPAVSGAAVRGLGVVGGAGYSLKAIEKATKSRLAAGPRSFAAFIHRLLGDGGHWGAIVDSRTVRPRCSVTTLGDGCGVGCARSAWSSWERADSWWLGWPRFAQIGAVWLAPDSRCDSSTTSIRFVCPFYHLGGSPGRWRGCGGTPVRTAMLGSFGLLCAIGRYGGTGRYSASGRRSTCRYGALVCLKDLCQVRVWARHKCSRSVARPGRGLLAGGRLVVGARGKSAEIGALFDGKTGRFPGGGNRFSAGQDAWKLRSGCREISPI